MPTIQCDGGDLFGRRDQNERFQTEFLCEELGNMGIDAIGLGEQDLNYGLAFLREMIDKHDLPFTNANVRDIGTGELILPAYLIFERGGIKFGVVSVLDPAKKIITMSEKDDTFQVDDPVAVLRELVPRLREKVQTVILLGHLGDSLTDTVVKEVKGIDISVTGHSFRNTTTERILDNTMMLCASHEGQYLGDADIFLRPDDGKVMAISVEVTPLDEKVADDEAVLAKIEDFKKRLTEFKEAKRAAYPRDFGSSRETFLSDRSCKGCHEEAWTTYVQSGHMRAFATLRNKGQHFEPDCLVCHTTGYQYKNGYSDEPPNNRLINVQCEACHGYGTEHTRDGKYAARAEDSCVVCHDKKNSPEFDYVSYWEKIKH
ncbi:hypothetical protein COW53_10785 [bacterium CG17_big_fil_post_rev_8_21_14_2_50_64_8]|nr:MAG: hypothetical protein COW53_10785 [bacterium CG17_big_fil_post_rev_8_21_14_2_50_64_8]PJA76871.1 MAG: hypothetical protein CO151_01405 [bacterium CG_4_9_14_3_um_filter_65_15]